MTSATAAPARGKFYRNVELLRDTLSGLGLLALAATGEVSPLVLVIYLGVLAINVLRPRLPWLPSDRQWSWVTAFVLGFCVAWWWFFQRDPLRPILLFTIYLLLQRMITAHSTRDLYQVLMIAFSILLLASVLTTSILFLPICLGFGLCMVGSLLLLIMRREAEAVGALGGGERLTTDALPAFNALVSWRHSAGVAGITAAMFALTAAFFVMLPRYQGRDWFSGLRRPPGDSSSATVSSGAGDSVALGDISEIRLDHTISMRVRLPGRPAGEFPPLHHLRLRGQALTTFDGERWHSADSPQEETVYPGVPHVIMDDGPRNLLLEITQDRGASSLIHGQSNPVAVELGRHRATEIEFNRTEEWMRFRGGPRLAESRTFRAWSNNLGDGPHETATESGAALSARPLNLSPDMTPDDVAAAVGRQHYFNSQDWPHLERFTRPNVGADGRGILELAAQWAIEENCTDPIDIANAFARRFHREFTYTLEPQVTTPDFPVTGFLTDTRAGHCELFATSMVLMLRSLNIPARLSTGYYTSEWNAAGPYFVVRESHAHAWVEYYAPNVRRWLPADPTPPGGLPTPVALTAWQRLFHWFDANRHAWYRWVIDLDETEQRALYRNLGIGQLRGAIAARMHEVSKMIHSAGVAVTGSKGGTRMISRAFEIFLVIAVPAIAIYLLARRVRLRRRWARAPNSPTPYYRRLLRWLERRGHRRPASLTPGEFAEAVTSERPEWSGVAEITALYYRDRFASSPLPPEERRRAERLVEALTG